MKSIFVPGLLVFLLVDFCTAQCYSVQQTPPPPGSKVLHDNRCHLPGLELEAGATHTNMATCMKCYCTEDLGAHCCSMLFHYTVPDECEVITKDCTQKVVYKSDGSPCNPITVMGRK